MSLSEDAQEALEALEDAPPLLRMLATYEDVQDAKRGRSQEDEVQQDLRRWADAIEVLRADLADEGVDVDED